MEDNQKEKMINKKEIFENNAALSFEGEKKEIETAVNSFNNSEIEDKKINEKKEGNIEDEIVVHAMPKKFQVDHTSVKKAKKTGLIIMAGGFLIIVLIFAALYFFMFKNLNKESNEPLILPEEENKKDENKEMSEPDNSDKSEESLLDIQKDESVFLPRDNVTATTTATSTPEYLDGSEAATSASVTAGENKTSLNDTDGDGLTDSEENLLGSNINDSDSDRDGYNDFSELLNFYNPAGSGKIDNNKNFNKYFNTTFSYGVYCPSSWEKTSVGGDDSIMFKSSDGYFLQIVVQPNPNQEPIWKWYQNQFDKTSVSPTEIVEINGLDGIKNKEGSALYLTDKDYEYIFALSYIAGSDGEAKYKNFFQLLINSFVIER